MSLFDEIQQAILDGLEHANLLNSSMSSEDIIRVNQLDFATGSVEKLFNEKMNEGIVS